MILYLEKPDEITVIAVKSAIYWCVSIINDTFCLESPDTCCVGEVVNSQDFQSCIRSVRTRHAVRLFANSS